MNINTDFNAAPLVRPPVVQGTTKQEAKDSGYSDAEVRQMLRSGQIECQTCANRTYVDGSDDPGVSFKSPTHIDPSNAAAAVSSHESEHVNRNAAEARQEGGSASSSVTLFHAVCPECGRSYVSGGVTRTITRKLQENDSFSVKQFNNTVGRFVNKDVGRNVDAIL